MYSACPGYGVGNYLTYRIFMVCFLNLSPAIYEHPLCNTARRARTRTRARV
jgi:hypothetical protein